MGSASHFSLSKWYLDCVAENGDAIVVYSGSLRWRALSLEYSSMLIRLSGGKIHAKATLKKCPPPNMSGKSIRWSCPPLKLEGRWEAQSQPIYRRLFEASKTPIEWSCHQPRSLASVSVVGIGEFRGFGYVEFLEMSAKSWQLPLQELRWGRFLSEEEAIVWMDFRGPQPETLVFRDGQLCKDAFVTDCGISLEGESITLSLEETRVLREGALVSTALSVIPGVNKLLPAKMLNTHECKWRSRGILRDAQSVLSTGWAIHEVVKWP